MSRVTKLAPGTTELDQVWGLRPDFYRIFMEDYNASMQRVDPVLVELCRLRMATLLASQHDLALRYEPAVRAGLTEEKIRALPTYPKSPLFTERERRCLEFAEQFVIQSIAITDEDVARVQEVLGAEEFIYFVKALSVMDQLARSCTAFALKPTAVLPSTMTNFRSLVQAAA